MIVVFVCCFCFLRLSLFVFVCLFDFLTWSLDRRYGLHFVTQTLRLSEFTSNLFPEKCFKTRLVFKLKLTTIQDTVMLHTPVLCKHSCAVGKLRCYFYGRSFQRTHNNEQKVNDLLSVCFRNSSIFTGAHVLTQSLFICRFLCYNTYDQSEVAESLRTRL